MKLKWTPLDIDSLLWYLKGDLEFDLILLNIITANSQINLTKHVERKAHQARVCEACETWRIFHQLRSSTYKKTSL